jgi:hypothetical protein
MDLQNCAIHPKGPVAHAFGRGAWDPTESFWDGTVPLYSRLQRPATGSEARELGADGRHRENRVTSAKPLVTGPDEFSAPTAPERRSALVAAVAQATYGRSLRLAHVSISPRSQRRHLPWPRSTTGLGISRYRFWYVLTLFGWLNPRRSAIQRASTRSSVCTRGDTQRV